MRDWYRFPPSPPFRMLCSKDWKLCMPIWGMWPSRPCDESWPYQRTEWSGMCMLTEWQGWWANDHHSKRAIEEREEQQLTVGFKDECIMRQKQSSANQLLCLPTNTLVNNESISCPKCLTEDYVLNVIYVYVTVHRPVWLLSFSHSCGLLICYVSLSIWLICFRRGARRKSLYQVLHAAFSLNHNHKQQTWRPTCLNNREK